ncbi:MAG TPA: phospho-N-acetylmuramoyl-pentapeptide-transferase [Tenuifilaceae bacterium]|nr:phospho-N-acetylmuramoyl-pentapeptide-transferase [Tenuifilaceae bacterium]HPE17611.1 phospho-N-acetylmuramoyl-pentapeptide-transferase [Tenuifilaceae bacterium]HPJ44986.1 phospho-N-acetylmuramoyl-pentapeptide-transferase [Tenuifilaceae bacterium]HPQ33767.1 phospho-N-acetylmuramoyl-pentapeptide-transferase [Tenuifilaceae bacterium]HRX67658.1 phospho-N-acetylmuramoyl-pentapeptide-transferase [Tenuifilaceae bacterium]
MIYYLFNFLNEIDFPGAGMFQYISFRSGMAVITSLAISLLIGKRIIIYLQRKQIGEDVRNLGLDGQMQKKGTPTMGGIIILFSILVPVLLFCDLKNIYVQIMLVTTIWLGFVGFVDDYIKVFLKDKGGLSGKLKLLGQVLLGLFVGLTLYLSPDVVVREKVVTNKDVNPTEIVEGNDQTSSGNVTQFTNEKTTKTTIPFFKNNEFDYKYLVPFKGNWASKLAWIVFVLVVIFIVTSVSNGANLTDGLDGLATGVSGIIGATLGVFAYLSGNIIYADYLNIMYIPMTGELVVFMSATIGALIGFLWYNGYPAQVFMGDTGSLALGGMLAVFAILIRKELLIPILCGIFLVENLSVMIQVGHFKRTKRKYGEGRRIFLMAPLHHHYQKKGYPESKIVLRFWIIGIILAVITVVTLKIR